MPDFIPLSSQAQDYSARQNEARRGDEDDLKRRALDLRKRQGDNQCKAVTDLQREVEQDADTFASFLTGESESTSESQKSSGSPFDLSRSQEETDKAGDIFSQLMSQSGQMSADELHSGQQRGVEDKGSADSEVTANERDASGQAEFRGSGSDLSASAERQQRMESSPFSSPFMSWGGAGRQELDASKSTDSQETVDETGETGESEETSSSSDTGATGDAAESSNAEGASATSSPFGMHMAGAQGRGGSGDSNTGGQSGGGEGFDRAAQEAAALNVASLQSSLLNALQRPGAIGLDGIDETAGAGGVQAAELIDKLGSQVVERMLVTDPTHQSRQEVRLKIKDSVLKDTEVRVYRDGDEVHVEFITPSEESAQTLSQNASDLESTLRERLGASNVVIKIDKTDSDMEA